MHRAACLLLTVIAALQCHAIEVPDTAIVLAGYANRTAAEARLQTHELDDLEGLWSYPDENMTVAIERIGNNDYRMIVAETDNESVDCGTVMGYLTTTAKQSRLKMVLYSVIDGDLLTTPQNCVADFKNGTIIIKRKKLKMDLSVNLVRFLPSVFDGIRLYPRIESTDIEPGLHKISLDSDPYKTLIF